MKNKVLMCVAIGLSTFLLSASATWMGCSFLGSRQKGAQGPLDKNRAALTELSKVLTTAALDALKHAPTNAPTELAEDLLERDQQIEGVPDQRIEVEKVLAGDPVAVDALKRLLGTAQSLLIDRTRLQAKLDETTNKLVELGKLYEAERNKNIVRRIWHWALGTLGFTGIILLFCFFPFLIPMVGGLFSWVAGHIPKLVGAIGVVGKKAFDGAVTGIEHIKIELKKNPEKTYTAEEVQLLIKEKMTEAMALHDSLVEERKAALKIKGVAA